MSIGDHDDLRRLLGGYLLGGLDEVDTDRLDAHLRDCDECRAELDMLAPVPELLKRLPEAHQADGGGDPPPILAIGTRPSQDRIESLLGKMRADRTRTRRVAQVRWLAAAAVVLIAAAIGIGVFTADRDNTVPQVLPSPELVTAQFQPSSGSGLTGEAVLTPKTWGVSVSLAVERLEGNGPFVCQVKKTDGTVEQAAIWGPTPTGEAKVIGASSIQMKDVSAVMVADRDGHVVGTATMS